MTLLLILILGCDPSTVNLDSGTGADGGATSDGGLGDGGGTDGGTSDGGTDGGSSDGGSSDGGSSDGGTDGGSSDGGSSDGGSSDGGSDGGTSDGGSGDGGEPETAPDYRETGPYSASSTSGETDIASGCTMGWTRFTPSGAGDAPVLILGHGFLRSSANHTDTGAHLASWGIDTVVVDLCHSSLLDTDHEQNGLDMVTLADALGATAPLYAGQSAGGLAAILAGATDSDGGGVIGLDPVDAFDVGLAAAPEIDIPVRALFGESSLCNASNNGIAVVDVIPDAQALRITEADHCDFEGPTDWGCTTICTGSNDLYSDDEIQQTMRALTTAAALALSGAEPVADQWWTPGQEWYDLLDSTGAISVP